MRKGNWSGPPSPRQKKRRRTASRVLGKADEKVFWVFRNTLIAKVWEQASKCKDAYFKQEKEVRVVWEPPWERKEDYKLKSGYRASRGKLTRFFELPIGVMAQRQPIKAIMLGPKNTFDLDDVKRILAESGYDTACIAFPESRGPYC